jgi:hypothetical protein
MSNGDQVNRLAGLAMKRGGSVDSRAAGSGTFRLAPLRFAGLN